MLPSTILHQKLASINGKDYGGYQSLLGTYDFDQLTLQQVIL